MALTNVGLVEHDIMAWHHLGCASQAAVGVHGREGAWQGQRLDRPWLGRCGWVCRVQPGAGLRCCLAKQYSWRGVNRLAFTMQATAVVSSLAAMSDLGPA